MHFLSFSQQDPILDPYFDSLVKAQIYCWGREPFSEFKKCTHAACQKTFSIDDFFDSPSLSTNFLHTEFDCPVCSSPTQDIYAWGEFSENLREYFALQVSGILLINKEQVKGFNLFRETYIEELFKWEFATREDSFQNPELKKVITDTLYEYDSIICWQHLFIDETIRSEQLFWNILSRLSVSDIGNDAPVIVETKYESRVYPFLRLLGFQEICQDKYGYVALYLESFYKLRNEIKEREIQSPKNVKDIRFFLREAQEKIKNNT